MSYVYLGATKVVSAQTKQNVKMIGDVAGFMRATKVLSMYGSGLDFMSSIILANETGQPIDWGKLGTNYLRDAGTVLKMAGLVTGIVGAVLTPFGGVGAPVAAVGAAASGVGVLMEKAVGGDVPTTAQITAATAPLKKISKKDAKSASDAFKNPLVVAAAAAAPGAPKAPKALAKKTIPLVAPGKAPAKPDPSGGSSRDTEPGVSPFLLLGGAVAAVGVVALFLRSRS